MNIFLNIFTSLWNWDSLQFIHTPEASGLMDVTDSRQVIKNASGTGGETGKTSGRR